MFTSGTTAGVPLPTLWWRAVGTITGSASITVTPGAIATINRFTDAVERIAQGATTAGSPRSREDQRNNNVASRSRCSIGYESSRQAAR